MTTQHLTSPAGDVNSNAAPAAGQVAANPDDACGAPTCGQPIGGHPPVNLTGVPEGPMHVDGVLVGNARCGYQLRLALNGLLCAHCGGDNRRCTHTQAARAWTTRVRRQVVFPARAVGS